MQIQFWKSAIYWLLLLAAVPFWLFLIQYYEFDPDVSWFYHNPGSFMVLAVILPVLEEIVFRGFIQEQLTRTIGSGRIGMLTYANILTSIVFSALHLINHTPVWALLVFIPSLVFGYSKDRYDTLLAPILLHIAYNSGYYLIFGAG